MSLYQWSGQCLCSIYIILQIGWYGVPTKIRNKSMSSKQYNSNNKGFGLTLIACALFISCSLPSLACSYGRQLGKPLNASPTVVGIEAPLENKLPKAAVLLGEMVKSASKSRQMLLWSFYPGSVRGQVFGQVGATDPIIRMNSGGGWS